MNFEDYFKQAVAYYEDRDYGPALENFEAALRLDPCNEQLQNIIEEVKLCAKDKEEADYWRSQAAKLGDSF